VQEIDISNREVAEPSSGLESDAGENDRLFCWVQREPFPKKSPLSTETTERFPSALTEPSDDPKKPLRALTTTDEFVCKISITSTNPGTSGSTIWQSSMGRL